MDAEIPPDEMREMQELIRWFLRRYPTPAERLASARRRHVQASATIRHARHTSPEPTEGASPRRERGSGP